MPHVQTTEGERGEGKNEGFGEKEATGKSRRTGRRWRISERLGATLEAWCRVTPQWVRLPCPPLEQGDIML